MSKTLLVIGTRKGAFLLESDADRRDWTLRGPFCEGWPVYHAIVGGDGTIYAAAGSEWHGAAVWRSADLGETWEWSGEGLSYGDDGGRKVTKPATLAAANGRLLVGVEAPGIFESTDGGSTFSLKTTFEGLPTRENWDDPSMQPPGNLGISAIMLDPADASHWWAIKQGVGFFETSDDGATWTPRNRGLRREWPAPPESDEVGFCVHRLVRSPQDGNRMYQQNHVGMHRSDDGGHTWTEITEGLPSDFGFAAATHPFDRDTFYVVPLDPGHGRIMPEGKAAVWRTSDAGASWRKLTRGLPQENAHLGVLRSAMTMDSYDTPGLHFGTSTGQVFASADEGESWNMIADFLPTISSVEVAALDA